ncbi:hypothetical protein M434DRAFT_401725, partial [Hypoxylon sp. CO27-5]
YCPVSIYSLHTLLFMLSYAPLRVMAVACWIGLDWIGLDWTGLDWTGRMDWIGGKYIHTTC